MVSPSSCAFETMPRPLRKATTGASISSARARTSSAAPNAPDPTKIIGDRAAAIRSAAARTRSGSAGGAGKAPSGSNGATSAFWVKTFHGISTAAGPRRPDSISWNARATMIGAEPGYSARSAHFRNERSVASWSGISCRWPRPLPRKSVGTCPVRHSTGSLQPKAVSIAALALRRPGPGTTLKTPGRPVARA